MFTKPSILTWNKTKLDQRGSGSVSLPPSLAPGIREGLITCNLAYMLVTWTWTCCRGCHALPGNLCWLTGHQNRLCHIINKQTRMCNISGPYHPSHPVYTQAGTQTHTETSMQWSMCTCTRRNKHTQTHTQSAHVWVEGWGMLVSLEEGGWDKNGPGLPQNK